MELFQIALDQARRAENTAGEGMAWGNLGTVYRALEQFEDAISCHMKYRDNAERRLDIGGVAIMQHQLAMDYYLSGNLSDAESSVLRAFQTLEQIRAQIGEEDESKLSNFEKNQVEAYNLLQVVLVAQKKYKEAFVLADASRGRALSEIVQKRLFGSISSDTGTRYLNEELITESFENLREVSRKLSTTVVLYSVVKEFDQSGGTLSWVYTWVLQPKGELHFSKTRLQDGIDTKVELNDDFVVSLRSSFGLRSQSDAVSEILRCEKLSGGPKERKAQPPPQNDDVLESLNGFKEMVSGDWKCDSVNFSVIDHSLWDMPAKTKGKGILLTASFEIDFDGNEDVNKSSNGEPEELKNVSTTSPIEHKGSNSSIAKHVAQTENCTVAALESYGTGAVISKAEPGSAIEESLPGSLPMKRRQETDFAKCEPEDISFLQRINDPTGDHQNCQFGGSLTGRPSTNLSGASYVSSKNKGQLTEMGPHTCSKQTKNATESSCSKSMKPSEKMEQDQSLVIDSSNSLLQTTTFTVSSPINNPEELGAVVTALEKVSFQSPELIQCQETSSKTEESASNHKTSITPMYTDVKTAVLDCTIPDSALTVSTAAFTVSVQSTNHCKMAEGMQDRLTSNDGAVNDHCTGLINADIDLSSVDSGESLNSDISSNPMQSGNHTLKNVDEENPLSTNDNPVGSITGGTNASSIDPNEAETLEAFSTPLSNANHTERKEDTEDPLLSDNNVCEDSSLGPAISDTVTGDSASELTENENAEVSSPTDIEEGENTLASDYDLPESTADDPTNAESSESSDLHDDPELAPWQPMLNQVHKILIEPIVDFLPKNNENPRVTFIPQDFLLKVPFAALLGETGRRYVIEDFVISTSPAIHFLDLACATRERTERERNSEFSLLAVGNPEMPFSELPQLPSAQREVHVISEIVNSVDSEVFVGTRANKKDVVAAMS